MDRTFLMYDAHDNLSKRYNLDAGLIEDVHGNPKGRIFKDDDGYYLEDEHGIPKGKIDFKNRVWLDPAGRVIAQLAGDGKIMYINDTTFGHGDRSLGFFTDLGDDIVHDDSNDKNDTNPNNRGTKQTEQISLLDRKLQEYARTAAAKAAQPPVKKVISNEQHKFVENTHGVFVSLLGKIHKTSSPVYNNTSLGSTLDNLKKLKDAGRVKPDSKDHTLKESRYDKYSNLAMTFEPDINPLLNKIVQAPFEVRRKHIKEFEKNTEKEQSNLVHINSWLTGMANAMYYEYFSKNNLEMPAERINIPEHIIHEIYMAEDQEEMMARINKALNSYVDEDGRVYHNLYAKYLRKVRTDMNLAYKKGLEIQRQLNPEEKDPKAKMAQPFKELLPNYESNYLNYSINYEPKLGFRFTDVVKHNEINFLIASQFFAGIMPTAYLKKVDGTIEATRNNENKDFWNSDYVGMIDEITVARDEKLSIEDGVRPLVKKLVYKNEEINERSYDFIYENTKGNDIEPMSKYGINISDSMKTKGEIREKVGDKNVLMMWAYQSSMYNESFENYIDNTCELFTGVFKMLLANINDKDVNYKKMFRTLADDTEGVNTLTNLFGFLKPVTPYKYVDDCIDIYKDRIRTIVSERLMNMYERFPDMACMTLALMRGDLSK